MFKLILHLFTLLTLNALGITTQKEIEDWIQSLDPQTQPVVKQTRYGGPYKVKFNSDSWISPNTESLEINLPEPQYNFLKYSREAHQEECHIAGINYLHIIDFDSIVNGFDPELKFYAINLSQNDTFLQEELDKWIQNREILVHLQTKQHMTEWGIMNSFHYYKAYENPALGYKKDLQKVFQELCRHKISKQVTILTLCTEKISKIPLKFIIAPNEPFSFSEYRTDYHAIISNDFILEKESPLLLYHELNHMIHEQLGFAGNGFFSGIDDKQFWTKLNGAFERNLLSLQDFSNDMDEEIEITKAIYFEIFGGSLISGEEDKKIKIKVHQTLDYAQLKKNWSTPEEMFNMIGFIKVDDNIYVNRLSDLDIQKTTRWGHFYNDIRLGSLQGIEQTDFIKTIKKIHTQQEASPPKASHWDIWCKLHDRSNVEYTYTHTMEALKKFIHNLDFKD